MFAAGVIVWVKSHGARVGNRDWKKTMLYAKVGQTVLAQRPIYMFIYLGGVSGGKKRYTATRYNQHKRELSASMGLSRGGKHKASLGKVRSKAAAA